MKVLGFEGFRVWGIIGFRARRVFAPRAVSVGLGHLRYSAASLPQQGFDFSACTIATVLELHMRYMTLTHGKNNYVSIQFYEALCEVLNPKYHATNGTS